ncbi:AzlC family ABC transporter permease [Neomegalonema sp.]|uniref:AzlC family ABC transporter permease n=1 Tax=Neomegalonema sp. TaxID=2039713 RepID=UPI0026064F78|nr:AzlC family ABC transporter permease [Neomegalonema sp.]MDD2869171.1 AzlC family ABC transporter permease [Neomegalonema sp.]
MFAIIPFGIIWGAVAAAAGLDLLQTVMMSVTVLAGASQLASVELLKSDAPILVAVVAGAAVNLRFLLYSASMAPYWRGAPFRTQAAAAYMLFDQPYGLCAVRYPRQPQETPVERLAYFLGSAVAFTLVWHVASALGWSVGARIPMDWGVDFIVPLSFLAIFAPALRDKPSWFALIVAAGSALLLRGLPYGLGPLVAAGIGVAAGIWSESRLAGKEARS